MGGRVGRGERGGSNKLLWVGIGWVGGWVGGWVDVPCKGIRGESLDEAAHTAHFSALVLSAGPVEGVGF